MEEFEESEILWPDDNQHQQENKGSKKKISGLITRQNSGLKRSLNQNYYLPNKDQKKKMAPLRIPSLKRLKSKEIYNNLDNDEDEEDEMIPPHVMVSRRRRLDGGGGGNKNMAFSVCTGDGRTLKGRDLSQVRNSILRMTGFLETC